MLEVIPAPFPPFAHLQAGTGNRTNLDATPITKRGKTTTPQAYRQGLGVIMLLSEPLGIKEELHRASIQDGVCRLTAGGDSSHLLFHPLSIFFLRSSYQFESFYADVQ